MDEFDSIIELEDRLLMKLEPAHLVDGHDFGQNEMNVFIYTDHPELCYKASEKLITEDLRAKLKAAYRSRNGDTYTQLYPHAITTEFRVT